MTDLWPHQKAFLDWWRPRMQGVIADIGMSGGKSRIAVEAMERARCRNVLLLCPKAVRGIWSTEPRDWGRREWRSWDGRVVGRSGKVKRNPTVKERAATLAELEPGTAEAPLLVSLHYDIVWRPDLLRELLRWPWDMIVLDEIHRIKAPRGKAALACHQLGGRCRERGGYVLGLTGTFAPHSELDWWSQLRAVNPALLPSTFTAFRARFGQRKIKYIAQDGTPVPLTTPQGQPIWDGVDPAKKDELVTLVSPAVFTVPQAELDRIIGLRDPVVKRWTAEPDPLTRRVHDEIQAHGVTLVRQGEITAANAMVSLLRMAQVTSGAAPVQAEAPAEAQLDMEALLAWAASSSVEAGPLHDDLLAGPKARLLDEALQDIGPSASNPVVVFCRFRHDLAVVEAWAERAGLRFGELSARRRDALDDRSQLTPGVAVAAVQIQSGGTGVNLTAAAHAVFYALGHSLGEYLQAERRVHRHGQQRLVTLHHLTLEGTVDETISAALADRRDTIQAVTQQLAQLSSQKSNRS